MNRSGPVQSGAARASPGAPSPPRTTSAAPAAFELVQATDLPQEIQRRLLTLIEQTRLGADEQREIARELVSHAFDALEAGVPGAEVLVELDDPGQIPQLYSRATKRKRPLAYQLRRWIFQGLFATLAIALLVYAGLAIRFYAGAPRIRNDYLAQLNAPILATPESERAWPVYQQALFEWFRVESALLERSARDLDAADPLRSYAGVEAIPHIPADHPDRPDVVREMERFRPMLDRVIDATRRPIVGMVISHETRLLPVPGADRAIAVNKLPQARPAEQAPLISAEAPHLRHARLLARLLAFDAILSCEQHNPDRAVEVFCAMIRLSDQIHTEPFLMGGMVSLAIHNYALENLHQVLADNPDLFDSEHCRRLAATVRAARATTRSFDLHNERAVFLDILQRAFTDDGRGGGRLTPAGVRLINSIAEAPLEFGFRSDADNSWIQRSGYHAVAPIAGATVADRGRQLHVFSVLLDQVSAALDTGPEGVRDLTLWIETQFKPIRSTSRPRWTPLIELTPSYSRLVTDTFHARALADTTNTLLALFIYRHEHDAWPDSLEQTLGPDLDALPLDPFDRSRPIRYRVEADLPMLWYRGPDADDDAGAAPPDFPRRDFNRWLRLRYAPEASEAPDADIVVFPPDLG